MAYNIGTDNIDEIYRAISLSLQYVLGHAVEGDIAEFGTATGTTANCISMVMGHIRSVSNYNDSMHGIGPRKLHLFDSFQGFPEMSSEIDATAPHVMAKVWRPGSMRYLTPAQLRATCAAHLPDNDIVIYEGWYKDTLPKVATGVRLGFVNIDCDLYESTLQVLDFLIGEDHLTDGAVMLFDDWLCNRAAPEFGQQRAWAEIEAKYQPITTHCGYYSLAGHKKIYHRRKDRLISI